MHHCLAVGNPTINLIKKNKVLSTLRFRKILTY